MNARWHISLATRRLPALVASVALATSGGLWLAPAATAETGHSTQSVSRSAKPVTPTAKAASKTTTRTTTTSKTATSKIATSKIATSKTATPKPATPELSSGVGTASRSAKANSIRPQGVTVPDPPTNVVAAPGATYASVSFDAPDNNGGSPITGYTATSSPGGLIGTCTASPCVVTGLTLGTAYTFTVTATNSAGVSVASTASSSVTTGTPFGPQGAFATAGDQSAVVIFGWQSGGPETPEYFTVTSDPGGITATCNLNDPCAESGVEVTGLTNGTTYTFTVTATNQYGTSAATVPSNPVTPAPTVPGAPTGVSATAGNQSASVSFTAPTDDGGEPITEYTVTSSPDGVERICRSSPCTVPGLTNGTAYTFTVTAHNSVGDSNPSAASNSVTPDPTVPAPPTGVSATAGDSSASVSWTAPVDDGGSAITGYTATSSPGGLTGTCTSSPCTVSGLTNGTAYTFTVTATNGAGTSAASAASSSVTPANVPDPPTSVDATAGVSSAVVTFDAPTNDGGSPITSYTATASPGGATGTCTVSPCLVTGLTGGVAYAFTVHATNAIGDSAESNETDPVIPVAVPAAPTAPTATATATSVTVQFAAPDDGGEPITGYEYSLDGGSTWAPLATSASDGGETGTIYGLDPATQYSVVVRAINSAGEGAASVAVALYTLPAALSAPSVTAGISSVTVSWTPSTASTVTGYTVYAHPGSATCTAAASASSCVIGATAGTSYTYTVVANTLGGDSAPSTSSVSVAALSPSVPSSAPTSAPTTLTTTKGKISTVTAGESLTLVGTGYLPFSSITLLIYSSPVVLGTTVANAEGDFSKLVTLPSSLVAGEHNIVASGAGLDGTARFIRMPVTVAATSTASTSKTSSKTSSSSLAYTGTPAAPLALGGIACIVLGGITLTTTKRRRNRA